LNRSLPFVENRQSSAIYFLQRGEPYLWIIRNYCYLFHPPLGGQCAAGALNLIEAIDLAKEVGARVTGIVGRDGGYTAQNADVCLVIPTVNPSTVTPHSESFQTVVWHLMVSHPKLKSNTTKW
jgi:hypothetical protein